MLISALLPFFFTNFFLTSSFNSLKEIRGECHVLKINQFIFSLRGFSWATAKFKILLFDLLHFFNEPRKCTDPLPY